jgi:magnesium-transporting ATPase (P-type)
MRSLVKQKKGELTDMLIFLITIFILAIGLFVMMYAVPKITGGLKLAGMNNSVEGANAISSLEDFGSNGINNGLMLLFVGLVIAQLITAFMVRTHPIFLFLYIKK